MRLSARCAMRCARCLGNIKNLLSEYRFFQSQKKSLVWIEAPVKPSGVYMKHVKQLTALVLVALFVGSATAQQPRKINVDFKDMKLKNGLRVLLVEDHNAPVVSIAITYDVGSRNERPGRTGFAHLFEHM